MRYEVIGFINQRPTCVVSEAPLPCVFDGLAMDGMRTDGWAASKDVDALASDIDAAGEGVEYFAAGAFADAQPGDLRGAQHPGGGVGRVVDLVEVGPNPTLLSRAAK